MFALGTIINTGSIVLGGLLGLFAGKLFKKKQQEALSKACGISTLFVAIAGVMQEMLSIEDGVITSGKSMLLVLCILLGAGIGELLNIECGFERFGEWLKKKTGNSGDNQFVEAFLTASYTVSIGAMAIVGSIQDGLTGDFSILAVKSVLDFIIVAVITSSMGKGAIFSEIPVFIFEGGMTLIAKLVAPLLTSLAISYISLVGSVLIFAVGINLIFDKKFNVANMLPAIVLAAAAAYVPWSF